MTLKENVTELKTNLDALAEINVSIEAEKIKYEAAVKTLEESKVSINEKIDSLRKTIGEEVVADFKVSKTKKFFGGIGVQEREKIEYDSSKVFEWAKSKNMFIMLDTKSFEKSAEAMIKADPVIKDLVTITKEPKATFPKEIKLED